MRFEERQVVVVLADLLYRAKVSMAIMGWSLLPSVQERLKCLPP